MSEECEKGEQRAMRKLAAAVLTAAAKDYQRASDRAVRSECKEFLLRNSVWHEIAGLRPEVCARWIYQQGRDENPAVAMRRRRPAKRLKNETGLFW